MRLYIYIFRRCYWYTVDDSSGLGRFAVDISLNQLNGIMAGRVVNKLLVELPALRSLVMVIKSFLGQRSLNEVYSGGLGSYAIVCMAVSFLQVGVISAIFFFFSMGCQE